MIGGASLRTLHLLRQWCANALLSSVVLAEPLAAQATELSRLIQQYRAGNASAALEGLQALLRTAPTADARALVDQHLGFAMLRVRPAEAAAALRRSIAANPLLEPDPQATAADRAAWTSARGELPIPTSLVVTQPSVVLGTTDSISLVLSVPPVRGRTSFRVRARAILQDQRDTVALWTGRTDQRMAWDGRIAGGPPPIGRVPLVLEVIDDLTATTVSFPQWLDVRIEPVVEPLALAEMPALRPVESGVTVENLDRAQQEGRRAARWMLGGSALALVGAALVQPAVDYTPAGGAPRVGVAAAYGGGLLMAGIGVYRALTAGGKGGDTTVALPDEAAANRNRAALARWRADSSRVAALNARLPELQRVTVSVEARR